MSSAFFEWITMGGYAVYVWPSYLLGLFVLLINICLPLIGHHQLLKTNQKDDETKT